MLLVFNQPLWLSGLRRAHAALVYCSSWGEGSCPGIAEVSHGEPLVIGNALQWSGGESELFTLWIAVAKATRGWPH